MSQEVAGTCKWFDEAKGYGFLTSDSVIDENGVRKDIFIHYKHIVAPGYRKLVRGELVTFKPVKTDKGVMATEVKTGDKPQEGVISHAEIR
jgi:cold shock protein